MSQDFKWTLNIWPEPIIIIIIIGIVIIVIIIFIRHYNNTVFIVLCCTDWNPYSVVCCLSPGDLFISPLILKSS